MELLRPKWVAGHLLALVLAAAFVTAGFWQIARNDEANDKLARERAAFAAPAPDIDAIDVRSSAARSARVTVTGVYDRARQALLRGRSRDGKSGYDVLTPLRTAAGDVVLVDRGWIRLDRVDEQLGDAGTPAGSVTVRGRLQPTSSLHPGERVERDGGLPSVPRVDPVGLGIPDARRLLPAYVVAEYQQPAPAANAPALPEPAKTSRVNHISYAIQWFAFAAIAVIGWPIVLMRATRRRRPRPRPA